MAAAQASKERPILFAGAMVRALLDGSKTQTRRALHNQVTAPAIMQMAGPDYAEIINEHGVDIPGWTCPYGQPGDRLWVRETFLDTQGTGAEYRDEQGRRQRFAYAADTAPGSYGDEARKDYGLKWKPSIHMPRAASRILLEIVSVRVERLQDISEADAFAEGIEPVVVPTCCGEPHREDHGVLGIETHCCGEPIEDEKAAPAYRKLWEQINGAGSWDANPWVWVVEFNRVAP